MRVEVLAARGLVVEAPLAGERAPVLRGLNFALPAGRVLGLVGEAGAGKSMVGLAIAGLMPAGFRVSAGALEFGGVDLVAMADDARGGVLGREIGFLPSDPAAALDPRRSIGTQLDAHHRRLGVRGGRRLREYAVAALAAVGLGEAVLGWRADRLSAEDCQRVLIAIAFAGRPKLVVADEATGMLDGRAQARIVGLLRDMQRAQGCAVLFMTRDLRLAAGVCDEVAVMYAGEIVETGPAAEVLGAPRHPYTKCLMLAHPMLRGALRGERRGLYLMAGQAPGLRALARMGGCRFAPRCPVKADYCLRSEPPLEGDGHRSACLRTGLVAGIAAPGAVAAPPWRPVGEAPVLVLEGVGKRFSTGAWPRRAEVAAVRGASLRIAPGEFVGLVGESGSGKSVLGRLVMGLEAVDEGRIVLGGADVTGGDAVAWRHRAGCVQMVGRDEPFALNPRRRVSDSITQALAGRAAAREKRARALLAEMGMALELGVRLPGGLSAGERQRVAIARALCAGPLLLVADGIAEGLDVPEQAQLLTLLHRLRQDHDFALLFIGRDLPAVRQLCDRVAVMHDGEIVEEGPTETVFGWPRHAQTRALLEAVPG